MSKRFHVDPNERVDVPEVEGNPLANVITIRARMSVEIAGRVSSEMAKIVGGKAETQLGAHTTALLVHNILAWRGPDFDDLPCTPENIRLLPGNDPFIEKVSNAIGEQNAPTPSPKAPSAVQPTSTKDGALSTPASGNYVLENGTPKSTLRGALAGHLVKSENSIPTT